MAKNTIAGMLKAPTPKATPTAKPTRYPHANLGKFLHPPAKKKRS